MSFIVTLADRLLVDADDRSQATALTLAMASPGAAGVSAMLELCRLVGEAAEPSSAILSLGDARMSIAQDALGALVVHCFAALRLDYPAQPDAVAGRMAVAARAASAYPVVGTDLGHQSLDFAVRLVGVATVELSRLATSLAPVVRVETGLSLPSSLIAWDLYGDPARGQEIMGRNRTGTPMLMPIALEAMGF